MDRRMLAIGAATVALAAVGCGEDVATDRAIKVPEAEAEYVVPARNGGSPGSSDAAQGNNTRPQTDPTCNDCEVTREKGVEQQRMYYEGTRPDGR